VLAHNEPAGHALPEDRPTEPQKVPAAQALTLLRPEAPQKEPAAHSTGEDAPDVGQ